MSEIVAPGGPLPPIPDNMTIPQFLLDGEQHPTRPPHDPSVPWFIDGTSGTKISREMVVARTAALAAVLKRDYNSICWFRPANPAYTADELKEHLAGIQLALLVTHSTSLSVAEEIARGCGMARGRIIVLDNTSEQHTFPTVENLIADGLNAPHTFIERRLNPGEGKERIAFLFFSSGTTGKPKAVAISHYAVIANLVQTAWHIEFNRDPSPYDEARYRVGDIALAVIPFFHVTGMMVLTHVYVYGGITVIILPKFELSGFLSTIQTYRVRHLLVAPPILVLLCKHPMTAKYDISSLRCIMSGSAPLSTEIQRQFIAIVPKCSIGQGYGMTETCSSVALSPNRQQYSENGAVGRLLVGNTARVVKRDGSSAAIGEQGELWVRTPSAALGYYKNDEATKETFTPDGWVRTGDEVIMNRDAEITIIDRIKELIKVKGFQVAPAELEGVLHEHPDISDVCVVGIPDEYTGEAPRAFVVATQGARERMKDPWEEAKIKKSIIDHVDHRKVEYKRLTGGVQFVDAIPKNPSGKPLRRILRDQADGSGRN
ncbi:acetyl-CoA synthetase-like protein [Gloeophyllum trabeum ATCC 11539]|uniref:Acetyl-CoA synthetase-like protein n=1 Tax=Gloeophyllum trabeum (strain ATCC 11539 / FP-39264 / Madison 617) TaxID=670483 RepID=S7RI39_GLOTA|nr:acetyl-CoA synthetase-like protein [Gloeophyllum trabeum ATCC 11539]EPQ52274.1 acetyl-CoA synthetase-like protein [Gloeophyllum trabeum ATCC 11539]